MREEIQKIYREFCAETKRSGGVLVYSSIGEWHDYLANKLKDLYYEKTMEIS